MKANLSKISKLNQNYWPE